MKETKVIIFLSGIAVLVAGLFVGLALPPQFAPATAAKIFTIEDLPAGAESVEHAHETTQAEEAEQISMKHYATTESLATGGPIFGVIGYKIVSIEYEIKASDVPAKTVGQKFGGYLLRISGYGNIAYDHFHISVHDESLQANIDDEHKNERERTYSIHFMLITHEEELGLGLVCE